MIKQLVSKPREKLKHRGVASLSDEELVQLILGSGSKKYPVAQLSAKLLAVLQQHRHLNQNLSLSALTNLEGVQLAKAARFVAALELSQRLVVKSEESITLPTHLAPYLRDICARRQEHLVVFTLNGAHRIIDRHLISVGLLDAALAHPREIYYKAIVDGAAAIIIAHNHPSGVLAPSREDKQITRQLAEAGKIIGIDLLDHLIVNAQLEVFSFTEKGMLR